MDIPTKTWSVLGIGFAKTVDKNGGQTLIIWKAKIKEASKTYPSILCMCGECKYKTAIERFNLDGKINSNTTRD